MIKFELIYFPSSDFGTSSAILSLFGDFQHFYRQDKKPCRNETCNKIKFPACAWCLVGQSLVDHSLKSPRPLITLSRVARERERERIQIAQVNENGEKTLSSSNMYLLEWAGELSAHIVLSFSLLFF